ncbi:uncharacterized protein [Clytia hemisphaerica]|uniref:Uncharacterized protein n=1 Tax=Clytia hemisphaerica TaxID=252671 RepID=A0A7M5WVG1_9CNID|eukprot:TCONS_00070929-protein
MGSLTIFTVLSFVAFATASDYHLRFTEKGQQYDERVHIDKQNGILIYRVPAHAGLVAAHYLKDFNKKLNVIKIFADKKCYVSKMSQDEPTMNEVELGMKKAGGVFDFKKYWIETEEIIPVGHSNKLSLSPAILNFCGSFDILDTVESTDQMEKVLKQKAIGEYTNGKSKRLIVNDYVYCKNDAAKMNAEMSKCNNRFDQLEFRCKVVIQGICTYRLTCKLTGQGYDCPGVHRYHHINCCSIRCKV